jgi:hypothetical protein
MHETTRTSRLDPALWCSQQIGPVAAGLLALLLLAGCGPLGDDSDDASAGHYEGGLVDRGRPDRGGHDAGAPLDAAHLAGDRAPGTVHAPGPPHLVRAPEIYRFEVSPEQLGHEGGEVRLRFSVEHVTHLRVVREPDGEVLCDAQGPCVTTGDPHEGWLDDRPPFERTGYRLEAGNGIEVKQARVEVTLQRPAFPDWPYNEIAFWMLEHRHIRAPYTFVVITDSQPATGCPAAERPAYVHQRERIAAMVPPPDFVLSLGDVVKYGAACEWDVYVTNTLQRFVDGMGIPWITAIGNHELYDPEGMPNFVHFAGAEDFAFDVDKTRFVSVNTFHRRDPEQELSDAQYSFVAERIDQASASGMTDVILAMHLPPFTPALPGDCGYYLLNQYEGVFEQLSGYLRSEDLIALLESHAPPVSMGLFGHVHVFAHYERNDVHYVVSGGGGGHLCEAGEYDAREDPLASPPYRDGIFHHMLRITVWSDSGQDIEVEVLKLGEDAPVEGYSFSL